MQMQLNPPISIADESGNSLKNKTDVTFFFSSINYIHYQLSIIKKNYEAACIIYFTAITSYTVFLSETIQQEIIQSRIMIMLT